MYMTILLQCRYMKLSGGASPLLMAGHKQVISRISTGSPNILIYNFIITTVDCQGGSQSGGISASAFGLARPGVSLWRLIKLSSRLGALHSLSLNFSITEKRPPSII